MEARDARARNVSHNRHRRDAFRDNKPGGCEGVVLEVVLENVRRYRALASLCRQQAAYRPLQAWELLGQAEHFEHLAETALRACFDDYNAQREADAIAAAAWERPTAA